MSIARKIVLYTASLYETALEPPVILSDVVLLSYLARSASSVDQSGYRLPVRFPLLNDNIDMVSICPT